MEYIHIDNDEPVVAHAFDVLSQHLQAGEHVVWLLSGGSAIGPQVRIAQTLQSLDTSRLHISLIDERYGSLSHEDENYLQLINAGFPLPMHRVLTGDSGPNTAKKFGEHIEQALQTADFSVGMFGVGADGHVLGIKPGSPAVTSTEPAVFYEWDDYQRITLTPPVVCQLDEAILYATGANKANTLRRLVYETVPMSEQPAQLLKEVKKSTLYTDNLL